PTPPIPVLSTPPAPTVVAPVLVALVLPPTLPLEPLTGSAPPDPEAAPSESAPGVWDELQAADHNAAAISAERRNLGTRMIGSGTFVLIVVLLFVDARGRLRRLPGD
ncbi:MAG TPA: hypothetical protein VGB13_02865, partial [Candidatus Krumholzibacteria bacterium]